MRRIDLNWGGYKDGTTFLIDPALAKDNVSDFVAQPAVAKLRTAVAITRDAQGFTVPVSANGQTVMGIISFGFIDRLGTREAANANMIGAGEGLSVVKGRGGFTLPTDMMSANCTDFVAGQKLYVDVNDGKIINRLDDGAGTTFSYASLVIGSVDLVDGTDITIDFKL